MGLAQILTGSNGEAEPRLTSGGEAAILTGFNGEAEPRLTSGGEAATLPTKGLFVQSCVAC